MIKSSPEILCCVDRFSRFKQSVAISGWAFSTVSPIASMELRFPSGRVYSLGTPNLTSSDVSAVHGPIASRCRFDAQVLIKEDSHDTFKAELIITISNGKSIVMSALPLPQLANSTHKVTEEFSARLKKLPTGCFLEIGSRARSGITRKNIVPPKWSYTGLDVMGGENVDVVGDAHKLSKIFKKEKFDSVVAFSVLEHLLMPWKFALELNKVLNTGAVGLFTTHQAWPLHDEPWDFWRFSDKAWSAFLNKETGFEIITTALGEPASTVAWYPQPSTDFGDQPCYLSSVVLFKKIRDTKLEWPVELEDIIESQYPNSST